MSYFTWSGGYPVSRIHRWMLVGWCFALIGGFALAMTLEPDPRGYGTHQRLGLPPCTFQAFAGIPCPGCGMTTSFAHFVRGNFSQSIRANIGGALLAVVCLLQIPWSLWSAGRGRLAGILDPSKSLLVLLGVVGAVSLVNWFVRLTIIWQN